MRSCHDIGPGSRAMRTHGGNYREGRGGAGRGGVSGGVCMWDYESPPPPPPPGPTHKHRDGGRTYTK